VLWFIRHHSAFFDTLKNAGYVRVDPLNPEEWRVDWRRQDGALVRIRSLADLELQLTQLASDFNPSSSILLLTSLGLKSPWGPAGPVIFLSDKVLFHHPDDLIDELINQWMESQSRNEEEEFFTSYLLLVNDNNAVDNALHGGTRGDIKGGLVLFPSTLVSKSLLQMIQEFVYDEGMSSMVASDVVSNDSQRKMQLKVVHLCDIYSDNTHHHHHHHHYYHDGDESSIIYLVRRSQSWINYKNFAADLGFSCN